MSKAIFTVPNYRLSKLLRQSGGKSVAAAVKDASDGVASLAQDCLKSIDELLVEIDRGLKAFAGAPDKAAAANALYKLTNQLIGLAGAARLDEMDRAAYSLCDLLDRMSRARRWDVDAVAVHVQALHLLRNPNALGSVQSLAAVLVGLKKVRDKVLAGADEVAAPSASPPLS